MGDNIGSGLSFKAICFDFFSTNIGSSVIGTHTLMTWPINDIPYLLMHILTCHGIGAKAFWPFTILVSIDAFIHFGILAHSFPENRSRIHHNYIKRLSIFFAKFSRPYACLFSVLCLFRTLEHLKMRWPGRLKFCSLWLVNCLIILAEDR